MDPSEIANMRQQIMLLENAVNEARARVRLPEIQLPKYPGRIPPKRRPASTA